MSCCHRQDAYGFLDDDEPAVLIDNLHVTATERLLVALRLRHCHLHTWLQQIVKLRDRLAIHLDALSLQRLFDFRPALLDVFQQELQQRLGIRHLKVVVFPLLIYYILHCSL